MLQFYFLSILLNVLAGLIFIYAGNNDSTDLSPSAPDEFDLGGDDSSPKADDAAASAAAASAKFKVLALSALSDKTFQLVLGILAGLTALMKLLSPIQYDIAIIGDLVPALAGIASSACLLLGWYQDGSDMELNLPPFINTALSDGKKYIGIFCIIAGVLQFIFPRVLFL